MLLLYDTAERTPRNVWREGCDSIKEHGSSKVLIASSERTRCPGSSSRITSNKPCRRAWRRFERRWSRHGIYDNDGV